MSVKERNLITKTAAKKKLGDVCDATFHRWSKLPGFPLPIRMCPNGPPFYDSAEIDEYIEARITLTMLEGPSRKGRPPKNTARA